MIALLAAAALIVAQDWRLWQRYLRQPDDIADPANALWFSPRAEVGRGDGTALPVAKNGELTLPADEMEQAWRYAESMGTDALIIAHDGVIQFERYGDGVNRKTLFQSQALHKGLTAMALGAAIEAGAIPSADTAAAIYLTEWADSENGSRATLADLAHMQAGLQRPRVANHPFSPGLQLFLTGDVAKRALSTPSVPVAS
jgi:CubicO group peptidase (beta-lactamase class C family)